MIEYSLGAAKRHNWHHKFNVFKTNKTSHEHPYNFYRKQKIELAEWMKVWRNYQMRMTQLDAKEVIEVVLVAEDHVLDLVIVIDEQEAAQEIGKQ